MNSGKKMEVDGTGCDGIELTVCQRRRGLDEFDLIR
jgi:hypothetical protein